LSIPTTKIANDPKQNLLLYINMQCGRQDEIRPFRSPDIPF